MGYKGFGPEEGIFVEEEEAFSYALDRCLYGSPEEQEEFKQMLKEWYYSGNWIGVEEDDKKLCGNEEYRCAAIL